MLLLGLGAACAAPEVDPLPFAPASATASPAPSEFGPFAVGVRTVTFEDSTRKKADGSPRLLVTEIWYPATQASRGGPGASYELTSLMTAEQAAGITDSELPPLVTQAIRDAPPASSHGPFPLVIFSHGQGAMRWQSTFFTVLLASHGYVVVSPDHEGNTLADALRDQLSAVTDSFDKRPTDVIYLVRRLSRLPEADPLAGLADTSRYAVTGHSFGGLTSLRVAAMDPKVAAIVPMTPTSTDIAWLGLPQPVKLNIPVMLQAAHLDRTLKWDEHTAPAWAALSQPKWLLDVVQGGHFTFSDLCGLDLPALAEKAKLSLPDVDLSKVLQDGCGPPAPPATVAQPLINHFAVGFLNAYLRGSEGSRGLLTQQAADGWGPGIAALSDDGG